MPKASKIDQPLINDIPVYCACSTLADIESIVPNPRNPNHHSDAQVELLAKIIRAHGWRAPITVSNRSGFVVRGHCRLMAARKLGLDKVPVDFQDYRNEAEEQADLIADNRLSELSDPDPVELKDLIHGLEEQGYDIELTGYNLDDLAELVPEEAKEAKEDNFDPDAVVDTIVKPGEIWVLGMHRLMCGDSTKAEDVETLMGGVKADMVFTDPPYNALKSWHKYEAHGETRLDPSEWFDNDNMEWPEYEKFLTGAFSHFTGHSIYICCDFRIYPIIVRKAIEAGYAIKHCIVWKKNQWGLGKRYRFQHEFIVYACKDKAPFYGDRAQSDVWEVDNEKNIDHNTPKPVKLPAIAIGNSSQQKDIVLDLFLGSGTTLIACEQLDRTCYGMELDPHYCDVIIARWEKLTGKKAVKA